MAESIPFTKFAGKLKQIDTSALPDVFDLFFPRFRTERERPDFVVRGRGRVFAGGLALGGDSAVFVRGGGRAFFGGDSAAAAFVNRGRERRFAGDDTLERKRYYCLADSPSNDPSNNTLLGELFAYADPRLPVVPELLDSTVDTAKAAGLAARLDWGLSAPCILHIIRKRENPWLFSPVFGIAHTGGFFRYPMLIVDVEIDGVVDLRLPSTLDWLMRTFVELECSTEFRSSSGESLGTSKRPPEFFPAIVDESLFVGTPIVNAARFVPTILDQNLGGGTPFIQGIGAWLRANGAKALIYPSARSDSRAIIRDNVVTESFGYILVDYRGSPLETFDARRFFGALPSWQDRRTSTFRITGGVSDGEERRLQISGVRTAQQARFGVFHDWSKNSLNRAVAELGSGAKTLGDRVELALRYPSTILGPWAASVLGGDHEFLYNEGGPSTGFLSEWTGANVASFLASILPAPQSDDWESSWRWDGKNWFLHRKCFKRPWIVLKCPVCWIELFWKVTDGSPMAKCCHCSFANRAKDPAVHELPAYLNWAQELLRSFDAARTEGHDVGENSTIYRAVCENLPDAVTGRQSANGPGKG